MNKHIEALIAVPLSLLLISAVAGTMLVIF